LSILIFLINTASFPILSASSFCSACMRSKHALPIFFMLTSSHQRKSRQRADGSPGCASTHPRRKSARQAPICRQARGHTGYRHNAHAVSPSARLPNPPAAFQPPLPSLSKRLLVIPKRGVHPSVVIPDHAVIRPVIHSPCLYGGLLRLYARRH